MDTLTVIVFGVVYLGMILGGIPGLNLDRAGIALLGTIVLLAGGRLTLADAAAIVDLPTIALLLGLMVVSAQFRLGGFYSRITTRLADARVSPAVLLGLLVFVAGALSSLLSNDIVCLAMAPVLIEGCARRRLNPVPFLLGLACAANVGSAATLIGNPQNMLIGQTLHLSFAGYLLDGGLPAFLGLFAVWGVIVLLSRGRWESQTALVESHIPVYSSWQTGKGLIVLAGIVILFLTSSWQREIIALAGAGVLLTSRRMSSREMLGLVDWQLLILFCGLFVINAQMRATGLPGEAVAISSAAGIQLEHPVWLFGLTAVLSNVVSNVPAVMLLLPYCTHPKSGAVVALASTLAGNLLIVGSIANIIVVDQAARMGVRIDWKTHARVGVPVTLATMLIAAIWLVLAS
ncbi:MAG: anion transporter [Candidatus Zixiibacteriota bacterium]